MTREELHNVRNKMQAMSGWLELGRLDKLREAMQELTIYLLEVDIEEVQKVRYKASGGTE